MSDKRNVFPGVTIAAIRGGSGKTVISLGITAALKDAGHKVVPFKKGPDYIDAGWLALAAEKPCYNLDTFLTDDESAQHSYVSHFKGSDIAVVEGNRGLYDGIDTEGKTSTAEIAKLLDLPVILCIDCTKSTRTLAATVLGCMHFDPEVRIAGVILNRLAGARHESKIRASIEKFCKIPVIGALPKLPESAFPERHMGLIPTYEHFWASDSIKNAAEAARKYIDLDAVVKIAGTCQNSHLNTIKPQAENIASVVEDETRPKIGVIRDSAFQFYYPDNLEALEAAGAELVFITPLKEKKLPELDAVYIGGGFPETHAKELSENESFRDQLKGMAEKGMPIYAECGGLMYMGKTLRIGETDYPMTGILPISFGVSKKPQGHGYTSVKVNRDIPFYKEGTTLNGHEFRYSKILEFEGEISDMAFDMTRGTGIMERKDGLCHKNVMGTYTHIHASGTPEWAENMVANARNFRDGTLSSPCWTPEK